MSPAPSLAILIMAAGQSRRMGRDKLLMRERDGQTLLANRIAAAHGTGHPVFVALPDTASSARMAVVQGSPATPLPCPNGTQGLGHSLSDAMARVPPGVDGVMIVLADMPALSQDDLRLVSKAFDPDRVVRGATADLVAGHPVLIPKRFLDRLSGITGDRGAQGVLASLPTTLVPLPGTHAVLDVDTPDDWAGWLARPASAEQ